MTNTQHESAHMPNTRHQQCADSGAPFARAATL